MVIWGGGGLGVTNSNVWGRCQTARLLGTTFGTDLRIRLGTDIYLLLNLRSPRDYVVRSSFVRSFVRACGMC